MNGQWVWAQGNNVMGVAGVDLARWRAQEVGNLFGGSGKWGECRGTTRSCLLTKVEESFKFLPLVSRPVYLGIAAGWGLHRGLSTCCSEKQGATGAEQSGLVALHQPDSSPGSQGPSGSSVHTTQSQAF